MSRRRRETIAARFCAIANPKTLSRRAIAPRPWAVAARARTDAIECQRKPELPGKTNRRHERAHPYRLPRRWDCLSLGEVMLRLDPGESRIHTTRHFAVWEGGGEYNVARGLRRCFGLRTAIATALADNPVGRLVEDLILQGGVDTSLLRWVPYDGVGREVRNGLNFTERGFGVRAAAGCSDRGLTAVSQLKPGDFDWASIFGPQNGSKWFHTGGIFAALSASTAQVAAEAMDAARAWDAGFVRPEFSRLAVEVDRRQGQGAGSESRPGAQGGPAAGQ
jgi:hypothetical protein